jgi:hypothetical protein
MGIRISELPEATTLSLSADYFPFIQDNITKRVALDKLPVSAGGSNYTIKLSGFDASAGTSYAVDTRYGTISALLPSAPTDGDRIVLLDAQGSSATYNIVAARNANLIDGVADNLHVNINSAEVELVWVGGVKGWQLVRVQ